MNDIDYKSYFVGTKTVADLTEDELRIKLCEAYDTIECLDDLICQIQDKMGDLHKIFETYYADRYYKNSK
jgi:hypothetical protein